MAEDHRRFDTCLVLRDLWRDDLGHLCRAAAIEDGALGRRLWLRILDGSGVPQRAVIAAFDDARRIAEVFTDPQLPPRPLFLIDDEVPGLAWEASIGQPLNRVLARARDEAFPMQPDNALLIVAKIGRCLAAAERIEIDGHALCHGFLHPGLVVISDDGEAEVTGFGLGPAMIGAVAEPDALPGAVAYLAPEVLDGDGPSAAGDVYSLGAILFHLLTGTALPTATTERPAAVETAHLAWDGEPIPDDIRQLLSRSVAPAPEDRTTSPAELCPEIENLVYGGAYSPTTFNLALFMDRLFRAEFEAEELARSEEDSIDIDALLPAEPEPEPEPIGPEPEALRPRPVAFPPDKPSRGRRVLWAIVVTVIGIGAVGAGLWLGRGALAPAGPAPTPTPSAAEIEARREAQEERLRSMTQAMVQEMMAEKESEIRQELMARQKRIEELQWRLQQSERRATASTAAAADEAATQQALKAEIEAQEQAQRAQEEALEAEADAAEASDTWPVAAGTGAAADAAATDRGEEPPGPAQRALTATVVPARPTAAPKALEPQPTAGPSVSRGEFIEPDAVDSEPVVVKSQPLTWPRSALRSGKRGMVVVRVMVNPSGGVDTVEVLRVDDDSHGIPEAALEAAKGYRFKPGFKDGVPITTYAFITWRYDFSDQ